MDVEHAEREQRVEKTECPLQKGDRVWRIHRQLEDENTPIWWGVHFEQTDKGDFMARASWTGCRWVIQGHKGTKRIRGIVLFLPKKYVPLDEGTFCWVVTGVSKSGKSVFVRPEPKATIKEYMDAYTGASRYLAIRKAYEKAAQNYPIERQPDLAELSCTRCPVALRCKCAWDAYNTDGDCLADK